MNKENIIDYVIQTPHNPNKKVLDDMLETLIEENGGGDTSVSEQIAEAIAKIPQNDWNQNDETAKDYIKNRTHYKKLAKGRVLIEKTTLKQTSQSFAGTIEESNIFVMLGDTLYPNLERFISSDGYIFGNPSLVVNTLENNGLPFAVFYHSKIGRIFVLLKQDIIPITFEAYIGSTEYVPLDEKYIPDVFIKKSESNIVQIIEIDADEDYVDKQKQIRELVEDGVYVLLKDNRNGGISTPVTINPESGIMGCSFVGADTVRNMGWNGPTWTAATTSLENTTRRVNSWDEQYSGSIKNYPSINAMEGYVAESLAAFEITVEDIDEICGATSTETILDEAILGETTV